MNATKQFKEQVNALQEVDIGDFRRRLILYINRLAENIKADALIKEIKSIVLYESCTDMEEIREKILHTVSHFDSKS